MALTKCTQDENRYIKWAWIACLVALAIRLFAVFLADIQFTPRSLEAGYLDATASLASGKGLLMWTPDSPPSSAIDEMKALQASGSHLGRDTPYPPQDKGWIPATLHPAGYSILLWGFYELSNTSGMELLARLTPAILDALATILLFLFATNIFNQRVGLYSAWIYAVIPSAIVLNLQLLPDAYARFFAVSIL